MKKTYNSPVCKVMTLNVKRDVMDRLFGNTSYIPVGDAGPKGNYVDPAQVTYKAWTVEIESYMNMQIPVLQEMIVVFNIQRRSIPRVCLLV